jgi:hypothetical protein
MFLSAFDAQGQQSTTRQQSSSQSSSQQSDTNQKSSTQTAQGGFSFGAAGGGASAGGSAAAGGGASASAGGFGLSTQNGTTFFFGSTQTQNGSTQSNPNASPNDPQAAGGNSSSSIRQSMSIVNDGRGSQWVRSTQAEEEGQRVLIEESNGRIKVIVEEIESGKKKTTVAKNAAGLKKRNAEAHELYTRYIAEPFDGKTPPMNVQAQDDTAKQNLIKQFREMRARPDVRGTPMEAMLQQMEQQVLGQQPAK